MKRRGQAAVIAVTGTALFMIVLDNLIVVSTLPSIQRSLHASLSELEWIVDAYILSFAVLMLSGAALGERFGRRRMLTLGLIVFSAASAAGGLAPNAGVLIAARVVQGAGAAVLMPLTLTLLSEAYPPERRSVALGLWSAISGVGVALGPIAGGLLTSAGSWHLIFWVNVPVGIAAVLLAPRALDESFGRHEPVDSGGLLLVGAGLLAVVSATVRANTIGWGAPVTLASYAAGALALLGFFAWERRSDHPMVPLRLFSSRAFSVANGAGFLLHFSMFGAFFMLIQYLAHVRGQSPVSAGLQTLPWTLMPLLVSPLAGRAGRRVSPGLLTAVGLALEGAGILSLAALVAPDTQPLALAPALVAIGVGIGIVLPNVAGVAIGAVPALDIGKASGTLATARQLGSVFGIAVPVAVFQLSGSYATALSTTDGVRAALLLTGASAVLGAVMTMSLVPLRQGLSRLTARFA